VVIDIASSGIGSNLTLSHELHPDWRGFASRAEEAVAQDAEARTRLCADEEPLAPAWFAGARLGPSVVSSFSSSSG